MNLYFIKAYNLSSSFRYPRNLFFVNGWYADQWWVGSEEEQEELKVKYNCNAAQRESLLPSTLAPATSGRVVLNYSAVADNGYVSPGLECPQPQKFANGYYVSYTLLSDWSCSGICL